jgi:CelD/BcsL family acetyltransferase involved in cellulose biosynthesis
MGLEAAPALQTSRLIHRVAILHDPVEALPDWEALERRAPLSPYQTRAWLLPWLKTLGAAIEPAFVVAYDAKDEAVALLPLGLSNRFGLRIASFLGGKDANTALGLFHPDSGWNRSTIKYLLRVAASRAQIDIFVLRNQPYRWEDRPNPLAALPHQTSPSANHKTLLVRDAERHFDQTLSKKARKHLRQKETKLSGLGQVAHQTALTRVAAEAILNAYFVQKAQRFRSRGIKQRRDLQQFHRFLALGSDPDAIAKPAIELHALTCGDRIVATFGGACHRGRFSGMFVSFDSNEDMARFSPGDLLIARIIAQKCQETVREFDLGIGEARYKSAFCPETEELFDTVLGMSVPGRVVASGLAFLLRSKRAVKQSAWLWRTLQKLQRVTAWIRLPRPG